MTFYDSKGEPIAYLDDKDIYLFEGKPVAYINKNIVYSFTGKHLGWFEDGWIRDLYGNCAFFTKDAKGHGPIIPITSIKPIKSIQQIKPIKSIQSIPELRELDSLNWSSLSGEDFFYQ